MLGSLIGLVTKASRTARIMVAHVGQAIWTPRNYTDLSRAAYIENAIAYRCVRMIAEASAAAPLLAYDGDREAPDHPILKLLARPNPAMSGGTLRDALMTYYHLAGNAYLEGVGPSDGAPPTELWPLRPDRMKVEAGEDGRPMAHIYETARGKVRFEAPASALDQAPVMHWKSLHPLDDWYGLAPVEAAARAIDVHTAAGKFNKALLDNGARPSGALTTDSTDRLDDDTFDRLKAQFDAMYGGPRNAGRPMILEGGLKWAPMGTSPKDLDFVEGSRAAMREIALGFGVPPMLLGIPGDSTYANYREANVAFWRQTVAPATQRLLDEIARFLAPSFGDVRLTYDADQVPALAVEREAHWERVSKADWLTIDEKRQALGYSPLPRGAGARLLVPSSMTPLGAVVAPGGAAEAT